MTTQEKENLKKELKKVIKKAGDTLYMTVKQMANNTATVLAACLNYKNAEGHWENLEAKKQSQMITDLSNKYKELLKGFPVTITTEIKTQYGLDYLYIRLSY